MASKCVIHHTRDALDKLDLLNGNFLAGVQGSCECSANDVVGICSHAAYLCPPRVVCQHVDICERLSFTVGDRVLTQRAAHYLSTQLLRDVFQRSTNKFRFVDTKHYFIARGFYHRKTSDEVVVI